MNLLLSSLLWGGTRAGGGGDKGVRFLVSEQECVETEVLCFYLRDCNNNHTSATGLVASVILSTVEQKNAWESRNYTSLEVCVCV